MRPLHQPTNSVAGCEWVGFPAWKPPRSLSSWDFTRARNVSWLFAVFLFTLESVVMMDNVESFEAIFTTDADLDAGKTRRATPQEVVDYLNANPRNAVVITDIEEESDECVATTPQYIIRGASESLDNFYFGSMPAEDPNDSSGGDLTAEQALFHAANALCS